METWEQNVSQDPRAPMVSETCLHPGLKASSFRFRGTIHFVQSVAFGGKIQAILDSNLSMGTTMKAWVANWRRNKGSDRPGYVQIRGWQYRDYVVSSCPFINAGDSDKLVDHLLGKCMTPSIADHMNVARNLHQDLVRFMHETKLPKRLREPRLELNM